MGSRDCPFIPEAQGFWKPQACPFQGLEPKDYPITFRQIPHLLKVENTEEPEGSTEEGMMRAVCGEIVSWPWGKSIMSGRRDSMSIGQRGWGAQGSGGGERLPQGWKVGGP